MPIYEYTQKLNIKDEPESEFEAVKREVLAKVNPDSHYFLLARNGKLEMVRFATFGKTATGEIFVIFHPISKHPVREKYCKPSQVTNNQLFEWSEDHLSKVGYRIQEIKKMNE